MESDAFDPLPNTSVKFLSGIESFYKQTGVGTIQDKTMLQPEYGMSSNEMKNVFHSISKYVLEHDEHDHQSSSVELQPFLHKGTLERII